MDSKITLSFDKEVIDQAKKYAETNNISLSRLVEFLLRKTTSGQYSSMEDYPISEWVTIVSEGQAEYGTPKKNRKDLKDEYFRSKK
ncbi:MAG TPA: DUF6364 family protein [Puia sp.]|nr:DUF6364 family protein [Puia sp.]